MTTVSRQVKSSLLRECSLLSLSLYRVQSTIALYGPRLQQPARTQRCLCVISIKSCSLSCSFVSWGDAFVWSRSDGRQLKSIYRFWSTQFRRPRSLSGDGHLCCRTIFHGCCCKLTLGSSSHITHIHNVSTHIIYETSDKNKSYIKITHID